MKRAELLRVFVVIILSLNALSSCPAGAHQIVKVAMRDGLRLATDVYLPEGEGPWPAILIMTPYGRESFAAMARVANQRGYALVSQDFRGRFDSESIDYPVFVHLGWGRQQDGYDTVEWIAAQEWSNGKVGGFGTSASGIALNMMAPSRPPHLVCCYVGFAFSDMYSQCAYQGGAFRKSLLETWLEKHKFDPRNIELIRAHQNYDRFWEERDPERMADHVDVPMMFVGGWYDIYATGSVHSFLAVNHRGDEGARNKCRLVMEPYGHGRSKDLVFANARHPTLADPWNWFDIWMKKGGEGIEQIPTVQYFVMGDPDDPNTPGNQWRMTDDWPVRAQLCKVYFHTDKRLRFIAPQKPSGSFSYKYNPKDPVPTIGGANLRISEGGTGPKDQRPVENRADVLLFTSPLLDRHIEISGPVKVKLWASSTATDTDFTAKLCDIYPDGRSMIVLDGILRASHRNTMLANVPMEPGKIYDFEIQLGPTSLVISPGHRIRIAISSSNAPRFEPNPNTGKPFGPDGRTEIATNTIYVNANHPSHVLLPIRSPVGDPMCLDGIWPTE